MNKKISLIITIILISNIIRYIGVASDITSFATITRVIYAFMTWGLLLIFPYKLFKYNDFGKLTNTIIKVLLLLGIYQIIVTIFNNDPVLNTLGNKYITLFTNPNCAISFIAPLFIYCAMTNNILNKILSSVKKYIYTLIPLVPFYNFFITTPFFFLIFKKYVNKKTALLIILSLILCLFTAIGGARTAFGILALCITAYFINYTLSSRILNKIFCIATILLPFILFIPMLNNSDEESIFQYYSQNLNTEDEKLATDTRTFLYKEMAEDLTKTDSWLMGKGAHCYYYSNTFFLTTSDNADHYHRLTSEVTFLHYLLHGGIVYTTLYYSLFVIAILMAAFKGKSKFIRCAGAMLASLYLCNFISTYQTFGVFSFTMFVFMGCCLSKTWLNYSNKDINDMFKIK